MSVKAGWKRLVAPNGKVFAIDPGSVSTNVQGFTRESIVGGDGREGDTETPDVCFIECDVFLKKNQTVKMLDQTGIWQLEGRSRNAVLSEDGTYHGDGTMGDKDKVKVRIEAKSGEEVFV